MRRFGSRLYRVVPALATVLLATACSDASTNQELAQIRARLDSFAVTLTAVTTALSRGSSPTGPDSVTVGSQGAASLGLADAPVTIVEFTDYQCPFCARHASQTLDSLKREYVDPGKVRYVVRDLPLAQLHPMAQRAAVAARCAGVQSAKAYWAYHDGLFEAQKGLSDSTLAELAARLDLDEAAFDACLTSNQFAEVVGQDAAAARAVGLASTPAFVVGKTLPGDSVTGKVILGAYPFTAFESAIDDLLRTDAALSVR